MKAYHIKLKHNIWGLLVAMIVIFASCEYELPEAGSVTKDTTPPAAEFDYDQFNFDNYREVTFLNTSTGSTDFSWDFGDGASSTELEPVHAYEADGTYTVKLTVSDKTGIFDEITKQVKVVQGPLRPTIVAPGFEDTDLGEGHTDGRDPWRNSALGGVIQRSTAPGSASQVRSGLRSAKLPYSDPTPRIGYQLITVEAETTYEVSFYYKMTDHGQDDAFLTFAALSEDITTTHQDALASVLGATTVSDQANAYTPASFVFDSESSTEVALYFFNDNTAEVRLDDISIEVAEGALVPPTASYAFEQSESNYLEYSFTNNSANATIFSWNFGDGMTSSEESPMHVYAVGGVYEVLLTAANDLGITDEFSMPITIHDPVTAEFTYEIDPNNYRLYSFTNTSVNTVSFMWDFGDGYRTDATNPTHFFPMDGIWSVTLTATSSTGLTDEFIVELAVSESFIASINNPSFDGEPVRNDNLNAWGRGSDLENNLKTLKGGGTWTAQSTTSERTGEYGGKLPTYQSESSGNDDELNRRRFIYQAIEVKQNTDYTISWYMRNKDANAGTTVTADIYDAPFTDATLIDAPEGRIITTGIYNAASGHDVSDYTLASISFNSGASSEVFLFIQNDYTLDGTGDQESETFFDDFSITEN